MRLNTILSASMAALFAWSAQAVPLRNQLIARGQKWVLTKENTFNSTSVHNPNAPTASQPSLELNFINNYSGSGSLNAYLTGLDGNGAAFFLLANGQTYYPPNPPPNQPPTPVTQNVAIPLQATQGQTATVSLPTYISSGRIYFSVNTLQFAVNYGSTGAIVVAPSFENPSDPNIDANYGFVEFTWSEESGLFSNLSYVDFVGLVIGQLIGTSSGTCEVKGLPATAVSSICSALAQQEASDGQPWSKSCQTDGNGNYLRVLAPLHLTEIDSGALSTYYDSYVDQVWSQYTNNPLTITSGSDAIGNYTGQVDTATGLLTFDHGGTFAKPDITDILGCNSGPFANPGAYDTGNPTENTARQIIVPRLCAAFDRSTLLLSGGNVQPDGIQENQYYTVSPTNHYSRIVHSQEVDGKGYAFSYDDVHPSFDPDVSGLCTAGPGDATSISFSVGGIMSGNGW